MSNSSHTVTTETSFVVGDKEAFTGNIGEFSDWELGTRGEAKRIADGLGGVVVEEPAGPNRVTHWTDRDGSARVRTTGILLKLAVVVSDRVVARVVARRNV